SLAYNQLNLSFLNVSANSEIYTLSLHDALPIWLIDVLSEELDLPIAGFASTTFKLGGERGLEPDQCYYHGDLGRVSGIERLDVRDRKSTRLNSSHRTISYAVF